MHTLLDWLLQYHILDVGATVAATTGTIFLFRKSIWYWYIGMTANVQWLILYFAQAHLLAASLQIAYLTFGVYAIIRWRFEQTGRALPGRYEYLGNGIALAAFLLALLNTKFVTDSSYFQFTGVSLFLLANWLTAHKHIACWYFWIAGNAAFAVFLWDERIYATFFSQFIFIALSLWGLWTWKKATQTA